MKFGMPFSKIDSFAKVSEAFEIVAKVLSSLGPENFKGLIPWNLLGKPKWLVLFDETRTVIEKTRFLNDLFVGGRLGVGADDPQAKLQVESDEADYTAIRIKNNQSTPGIWEFRSDQTTCNNGLVIWGGSEGSEAIRMVITKLGLTGLGTVDPKAALHVFSNEANHTAIRIENGQSAHGIWELQSDQTGGNNNGLNIWGGQEGSTLKTRVAITKNGYMGIDDLTPSEKLDVNGKVRADDYIEYSPVFTGKNALGALKRIRAVKGTERPDGFAQVDHATLPRGVGTVYRERWLRRKSDGVKIKKGKAERDEKGKRYRIDGAWIKDSDLEEFDEEIPGRNLGRFVQVLARAVIELADRVEELERDRKKREEP